MIFDVTGNSGEFISTMSDKEELKQQLKDTLRQIKEEKDAEAPRGGLIPDPNRQLALRMIALEERIAMLEMQIRELQSRMYTGR